MFIQRSGNPALNAFESPRYSDLSESTSGSVLAQRESADRMTLNGTVIKTGMMVAACAVAAILAWQGLTTGIFGVSLPLFPTLIVGALGGLGISIVLMFAPKAASFLATPYAVLEGAFLAAFSLFAVNQWLGGADNPAATGIIFQAVVLTFSIAAAMLLAYGTGIIRGGKVFTAVVLTGAGGLGVYVIVLLVGNGLFNAGLPNLYASASPIGIGFTAVCLVLASLFLVLDFRMIDKGIKRGAPKHMEWYASFAVLATLVWIYIEVLRLLLKLQNRD